MPSIDRLFQSHPPGPGEFQFDRKVAQVFDDMIARSVPLYADVQAAIPRLARLLPGSPLTVIDLGCSTGTSLWQLSQALPDRPLNLIGTDNSAAMLEKCRQKLGRLPTHHALNLKETDLRAPLPGPAHLVLMNYTLQFVPVEDRLPVLQQVRQALHPGGMFVFSEKFSHDDVRMDQEWFELYFEYKRRNGYSDLEIARKRDALENVLIPLTVAENTEMLVSAGFSKVELLLKWFNFGTFLCQSG